MDGQICIVLISALVYIHLVAKHGHMGLYMYVCTYICVQLYMLMRVCGPIYMCVWLFMGGDIGTMDDCQKL